MKSIFYASIAIAIILFGIVYCHAIKLFIIPSWVYLIFTTYFIVAYFISMAQADQLSKQNKEITNRLVTLDTRMEHLYKKEEIIQMFTKAMTTSYAKFKVSEKHLSEEKVLEMKELMNQLNDR